MRSISDSPPSRLIQSRFVELFRLVFPVLFLMGSFVSSEAQDYEKIAPKEPPIVRPADAVPKPTIDIARKLQTNQLLSPHLKGLVIVSRLEQVKKDDLDSIRGFQTTIELLKSDDFKKVLNWHLDKPLTQISLERLLHEIIVFYRQHDRPIVNVVVPEQEITSNVLQLVVREGLLGKVRVKNNVWFSERAVSNGVNLHPGEPMTGREVQENLDWVNQNPFRQVRGVFTPGENRGETDLVLDVQDRFPVRFYAGYEDSGTDLTGDERWMAGFNWGNAFFLDHRLNYQFTTSSDFEKFVAHSGNYSVPLPWRHTVSLFGSYGETQADINNPLIKLNGTSWQVGIRYAVPLPDIEKFSQDVSVGFDLKQTNNNLQFGGAQFFNTYTDVDQFVFEYHGSYPDSFGNTSFGFSAFYSPGDLSDNNNDRAFNAARTLASADYIYTRLNAQRSTRLPGDFSWLIRGTLQFANHNLLGSEQLGLGGYSTVRGYDEREANGDEGYFLSTEIRTPPFEVLSYFGIDKLGIKIKDQLQVLAFFDCGTTKNNDLLTGEDPHVQLASVGPGVRYSITPYLSARFDYGWQLYDTGLNTRSNERGHLGIILSY